MTKFTSITATLVIILAIVFAFAIPIGAAYLVGNEVQQLVDCMDANADIWHCLSSNSEL